MRPSIIVAVSIAAAIAWCSGCSRPHPKSGSTTAQVDFNESIRPILNAHCIACHGGVKAASGLSFLFPDEAFVVGESGQPAIVPGQPEASYLLSRITDADDPMPPADHGAMLDASEVALLEEWIRQGAPWGTHWSLIPPQRPTLPVDVDWAKSPVDRFIAKAHRERGLQAKPPAEPAAFLRRLSLDLTGLPPTFEDFTTFAAAWNQDQDAAVATAADRLLASPAYGERMASVWMDLSRYADTMGYEKDAHRNMWPYRDGLIRSFNADKPYDKFLHEQLAGDLLPEPTAETLVATAFHRQTQTNAEGGTDDEEFRVAAVLDRVNTTWSAILGTSFRCVQCHAHPYDAFRHKDYYRFAAFFNDTADTDDGDYPELLIPEAMDHREESVAMQLKLRELQQSRDQSTIELSESATWRDSVLRKATLDGDASIKITPQGDLQVHGTVEARSTYVLDLDVGTDPITAIRMDAVLPPGDDGTPSVGFQLSQIEADVVEASGSPRSITLLAAATDFSRGDQPVDAVLEPGQGGWSLYPYQFRAHQLIVIPSDAIEVAKGAILRITLHHRRGTEKSDAHSKRFAIRTTGHAGFGQVPRDPKRMATDTQMASLREQIKAQPGVRLPVLLERPAVAQRPSHVFVRGNWMTHGDRVLRNTPGSMPALKASGDRPNRLDLARWMTAPDHPLTARVVVNRLWQQLFGRGIVATLDDFGSQGEPPTNQPLLDWLAVRLVEDHKWRLKPLLRDLATSAAYRQSARATSADHGRDPYNRWIARGPRTRLSAEMVRDQALAISGLLSKKRFGPSVMPDQPDGVWQVVYSGAQWKTSSGEDRLRRAVYTYWRRTSPYPSAITFDAPTREFCVAERLTTNTPLHALVTLNDPVFVEAANALAAQSSARFPEDAPAAIADMHERLTGQAPTAATQSELLALLNAAVDELAVNSKGDSKGSATDDASALAIVAGVLLNLDSVLTK